MSKLLSRRQTIWTTFVVVGAIVFSLVVGWNSLRPDAPAPEELAAPEQVARVNDVVITQKMVERELNISRLNIASPLPPLTGQDLAVAQEEALNQLVARQLILQAAGQQGFVLDADAIEQRTALLYGSFSDQALENALAQSHATRADLLWWVGEIFSVEEFITDVILADVIPEKRQETYNAWLNSLRANAEITIFTEEQPQSAQALVGEIAPNFTLLTLKGQPVSLSDYAGQVVLVNFWATWCPSCVTEMPDYEQVYRQHHPGFVVLGVNLQESPAHVQQYAAGLGLTFPVLLDQNGDVTSRQYRVSGMPGSFIINRNGVIFYRHSGPMSEETLLDKLGQLGFTDS